MGKRSNKIAFFLLNNTPVLLLITIFAMFGIIVPSFINPTNIESILRQASYVGIVAIGMTLVLITGGIDLSVGSNMYLSAASAALLIQNYKIPVWLAIIFGILVGTLFGLINAIAIIKLKILPFLATLSTMIAGRGLATLLTESRSLYLSSSVTILSSIRFVGIQLPILIFIGGALLGQVFLSRTAIGRHIYAIGYNADEAKKAGINCVKVQFTVYILCGTLAAIGGIISVAQQGNISAGFAEGIEFLVVAATVLGGTSLYGGAGKVFPGVVLGASLIQVVQAGLVYMQVNLYIQPIVSAGIIFIAVLIDSLRIQKIQHMAVRRLQEIA